MLSLVLAMLATLGTPSAPHCEAYGPRVDGVRVMVCDGRVVSMTDASGYTLAYPEAR